MKAIRPNYQAARQALSSLGVAVIETDFHGRVIDMNQVAERLTGWRLSLALGREVGRIVVFEDEAFSLADRSDDESAGLRPDEANLVHRDGHSVPVEYCVAVVTRDGHRDGMVVVFTDVTDRRLMAVQSARLGSQDLLTGLLNRSSFAENLEAAIARTREAAETHAVCFFDIDQFKLVVGTCGHEAGDELLQWVAALLRETVGEHDTLARFGGDEFAVLLMCCTLEDAQLFAEGFRQRLAEFSFRWGDKSFAITGAMGIVLVTDAEQTASEVLSSADQACYAAKEKGRGSIEVFESAGDSESVRRRDEMHLVARINSHLNDGSALLYAQPIRCLDRSSKIGRQLEVLLRFRDGNGEVQDPGNVIKATERYGLMPTVDRWVVRQTLRQLASLGGGVLRGIHVCFINLSGLSLQDDTVLDFIRDQLAETGVPPNKIGFEITETVAVQNLQQARWFIQEALSIGCRLALDDFGTGMASYSYLKALPVEYLKIDGGFVEGMLTSRLDRAMVESINQIAHVLGIQTVAESVGSQEILDRVRDMGINHAQGFWISHPRPFEAVCTDAE